MHWDIRVARYLKTMYPNAKFLFSVRHPQDAWRSYRDAGRRWFWRWPQETVTTPTAYGKLWAKLARDYYLLHDTVGGKLLRYEDLKDPATAEQLGSFLGTPVANPEELSWTGSSRHRPTGNEPSSPLVQLVENALLKSQVRQVAALYGYGLT